MRQPKLTLTVLEGVIDYESVLDADVLDRSVVFVGVHLVNCVEYIQSLGHDAKHCVFVFEFCNLLTILGERDEERGGVEMGSKISSGNKTSFVELAGILVLEVNLVWVFGS